VENYYKLSLRESKRASLIAKRRGSKGGYLRGEEVFFLEEVKSIDFKVF
jgi:hypothetical protein